MEINPLTFAAYDLLHQGTLALARAERQGIRVDLDHAEQQKTQLTAQIKALEEDCKDTNFYRHWSHSIGGKAPNIYSNQQLAHFLYKVKKLTPATDTTSGQGSTDEDALLQLDLPELADIIQIRKLKKIRDTYLDAFLREQVNGYIHPSFALHLVKTFRSCVAKGSLILAVRDFIKYPKGVPIEEIKVGDYVYCFDDNLKPAMQKVLWAGKTGHKEVIRIHYVIRNKENGYLDVTPEHRIRLIDGSYVQAQYLVGDFRSVSDSTRVPKIRALACKRVFDSLIFTGNRTKNGTGILEHRFIYEQLIGPLQKEELIHHKNEIHLDNTPDNLKKMSKRDHTSYHSLNASEETVRKRIQALLDNRWKIKYKKGKDNPLYLNLSKYSCLRILAQTKGKISKGIPYDFTTFKRCVETNEINIWDVKARYDKHGDYIWKRYAIALSKLGRAEVSRIIGRSYENVLKLYEQYGIDPTRKWANQFGEFKPGNHAITSIEWIKKEVDVYDIEVEKYHNFFANEICVHNSSNQPNFQNIPKRDKEAMHICRSSLFPRPGHQLMELDFSGAEVKIAVAYHKDPVMIKYIKDPTTDMHGDLAKQLFIVDDFNRKIPEHYTLRQASKNGFIFPEFYGSYYKSCAKNLACTWGKLPEGKWTAGQGIPMPTGTLSDHLIKKGITEFGSTVKVGNKWTTTGYMKHVLDVEKDFWGNRFKVYSKWKEMHWAKYQKNGYVDILTGFRCSGIMGKNDAINYPVQGAAFHCLLWTFIQTDAIMRKENWDTRIIGQIHDAIVLDVHPDEVSHVANTIKRLVCEELPKHWKWINVPLDVEADLGEVDASWAELKSYKLL